MTTDSHNPSSGSDLADATKPDVDSLGYGEALSELESILVDLESSRVDIDTLTAKVSRAAILVSHCRSRLDAVRSNVADVVADLDQTDNDG